MSKTKKPIIVYRNGAPIGYIKSVSYSRQKFFITQDINEAKGKVKRFIYVSSIAAMGIVKEMPISPERLQRLPEKN